MTAEGVWRDFGSARVWRALSSVIAALCRGNLVVRVPALVVGTARYPWQARV